jgi:hypothetical protein
MSRLSRKNRTCEDLGVLTQGSMLDLFDNSIKQVFRINDKEYDTLLDKMSEDELNTVLIENQTFSQKRETLTILGKYGL